MNWTNCARRTLFSVVLLISACRQQDPAGTGSQPPAFPRSGNVTHGCIQVFDAGKDYFPEKVTPEYAKTFTVEYHRSYKVVTVRPGSDRGPEERYILLQCGAPKPSLGNHLNAATVISIPISSLFAGSSSHHPLLVDLDRLDVLTGMPKHEFATMPEIIDRIKAGKVIEYGENIVNVEKVILAAPSMLMVSDAGSPSYAALRSAGVPVVHNTEWLEDTAMGRAEWVKFLALFLNEEGKARHVFDMVRDRYESLAGRTRNIPRKDRPKVMTGGVFRGIFSVAGGRSYVARLIDDAGADYLWSDDDSTGYTNIDIETVLVRAASADYWLNGGIWPNLEVMLNDDPRYKEFKAYRTGQVWLYNRKLNATGSYDYWGRGVTRPDLILADMIKIFHPDLARDHEFEWYKQVPAR